MTFREIIERENQNTDCIWLYREGMFMKAYEWSAFFAHTLIHEFKISKRYIKTVNMDVLSLGFPEQTIPKWLNGYVYEWMQDGLLRCHMRKAFDEVEFHNCKDGRNNTHFRIDTCGRAHSACPDIPYLSECGVLCRLFPIGSFHNLHVDKRKSAPHFLRIYP